MASVRMLCKSKLTDESPVFELQHATTADAVDEYNDLVTMHWRTATPASVVIEVRDNDGVLVRHYAYSSQTKLREYAHGHFGSS